MKITNSSGHNIPISKVQNSISSLPLIVITGPTASGKSSLAIRLAKKWGGEIICADSRTVYKDMNIGTAKPTKSDRKIVKHWLLDVVKPGSRFTVYDFKQLAQEAIKDIVSRDKIPFLVGGTGLYIDSVVLNFVFGPDADLDRREQLESLTVDQLITLHEKHHIGLPENYKNKRYLIRSIEKYNSNQSVNYSINPNTYVIAISTEKKELLDRISERADTIFGDKLLRETQQLKNRYGFENEAMTGNIYKIVDQLLSGDITLEEAKQLFVTKDWQLAKRQITWLRRHDWVQWKTLSEAEQYFDHILRNFRDGVS
ncbi:tRNA dimethylallyltransferase [Candidatus Saccharibacteria bacterium]|nr:tRNA dimethylallyltransferase [Candidatus Saccharibacteria bacterium]NCU40371.1 tRNA dimethylallyltransferase [Candidatus Saccharibacteria bacterium]